MEELSEERGPRVVVPEGEVQAGPAAVLVTRADSQPASCSDAGKLRLIITEIVPTGNSPGASGNDVGTMGYSLHDAQCCLESCEVGRLPFPVRRRSERVTPSLTTEETLRAMRRTLVAMAASTLSGVVVPAKRKSPAKLKSPAKPKSRKAHRKFANPNHQ